MSRCLLNHFSEIDFTTRSLNHLSSNFPVLQKASKLYRKLVWLRFFFHLVSGNAQSKRMHFSGKCATFWYWTSVIQFKYTSPTWSCLFRYVYGIKTKGKTHFVFFSVLILNNLWKDRRKGVGRRNSRKDVRWVLLFGRVSGVSETLGASFTSDCVENKLADCYENLN